MSETKSPEYTEGYQAAGRGEPVWNNPYPKGSKERRSWGLGWVAGNTGA